MFVKYTWDTVIEAFIDTKSKLLSTKEDFKNGTTKIKFICCECRRPSEMRFSSFINGNPKVCTKCRYKYRTFSRPTNTRYTQEMVEKIYESHGCKFLDEYSYNDCFYEFQCSCGNIDSKMFWNFQNTPMCRECSQKNVIESKLHTIEEVKEYLESIGCTFLDEEFFGVKYKINFICSNEHKATSTLDALKTQGNGHCKECLKEFLEWNRGENHYKWKGGTYDEESKKFRTTYEFKKWRSDVLKRDNYTCQICKTIGYLNVHHKDGYNWCIERRTDVANGVTLCKNCHLEFHIIYGIGDNTEEQFQHFIKRKKLYSFIV
ncbi:HNH endonuclease [Niallia taxi]|uniref:HNH endonuclease n=1 Tax=Niallia taxi TaxID=2499688 RepID=UPI0015F59A04|nr:HNH endonuclease signature motif containing protein [Niallia taxi]